MTLQECGVSCLSTCSGVSNRGDKMKNLRNYWREKFDENWVWLWEHVPMCACDTLQGITQPQFD